MTVEASGALGDVNLTSSFDMANSNSACSDPNLEEHPKCEDTITSERERGGGMVIKEVLTTYLLPQKPGEAG